MLIISYILTPVFIFVYILLLLIIHPLQWIGQNIFGYQGHNFTVGIMNYTLTKATLILGIHTKFENKHELITDTNYIFVANHQSIFDIPPLGWYFRKHHPKFVSKKELSKGIPSVSYNLRNGGSVLIDRKNGGSALKDLITFGKKINKENWSAVIFPEGTRSKTGKPKLFIANGLKILCKTNPEAYVVPITINNSWHAFKYGKFPLGIFSPITFITHKPIKVNSMPFDELLKLTEFTITNKIKYVS